MDTRTCNFCAEDHPYPVDANGRKWIGRRCGVCRQAKDQDYYRNNRQHILDRVKDYAEANSERIQAYQDQYKAVHSKTEAWRNYHRNYKAEYTKRPEVKARQRMKDLSRQQAIAARDDGSINAVSLEELRYEIQDNRCPYCFAELDETCHLDHVEPLSRGGWHQLWNVLYACPPCNWIKNDRLISEWIR